VLLRRNKQYPPTPYGVTLKYSDILYRRGQDAHGAKVSRISARMMIACEQIRHTATPAYTGCYRKKIGIKFASCQLPRNKF